jgi:hypothetical protein
MNFLNFDFFHILPRVPDYCASLGSRISPVTLYWFLVASFPVQGILSISAMDLESKYCYFYHILVLMTPRIFVVVIGVR